MKIEDHLRNINESLSVIKESILAGIQERQRNIGFNVSVASVEMLEVFLHKNNIINPGALIKHDWFSSARKAEEKLKFDFPQKEKIIGLLTKIESKRNILCYGRQQPVEIIKESLDDFNQIKSLCQEPPVTDWWHGNATLRVVLEHCQNSTGYLNHSSQTSGILKFESLGLKWN